MKFFNILDEQQRFVGLKTSVNEYGEQRNSHTYSYMQQRKLYQELGDEMGLDRLVKKTEVELQISDMLKHYDRAIENNILPPEVPFKAYVADKYLAPKSVLPALFRWRLTHAQRVGDL